MDSFCKHIQVSKSKESAHFNSLPDSHSKAVDTHSPPQRYQPRSLRALSILQISSKHPGPHMRFKKQVIYIWQAQMTTFLILK